MPALNPGDRVKLDTDDTGFTLKGTIVEIKHVLYDVRWDDGTEELVDGDLIEPEDKT